MRFRNRSPINGCVRTACVATIFSLTPLIISAPAAAQQCCLIQNGDFEAGNTGFGSSATYVASGALGAGQYSVRTDPSTANGQWCQADHTTGNGNFLMCDGASGASTTAWSQTTTVVPGETYDFHAFANNLICSRTFADPVIELRVNANVVAGPITLPRNPDEWRRISGRFVACSSSVLLEIVSTSTASVGNDFGIDDVCLERQSNLVVNGHFEAGNLGFTSTATFVATGGLTFGQYSVRSDPSSANGQWGGVDHTCGSGQFLICDGTSGVDTCAWRQSVDVCPGREYTFSAWVDNLISPSRNFADPNIELRVGGTGVLASMTLPESPDGWVLLSGSFVATSSPVMLEICSTSTAAVGNDFAIDDIRLSTTPDLITNGDFEAGNTGFSTNTTFVGTGALSQGDYSIRTDASTANGQWCHRDRTSGNGNFLVCDGRSGSFTTGWQQTIAVCSGESYEFRASVANLICSGRNFADPNIELRVNGVVVAGPLLLPENPAVWTAMSGTYVVPAGVSSALLEIRSTSTASVGNDFGVDDVSLTSTLCPLNATCVQVGTGCGGISLSCSSLPVLGSSFDFTLSGLPAGAFGIVAAIVGPTTAAMALPSPPFVPGCVSYLGAGPIISLGATTMAATTYSIAIPASPALLALPLGLQGVALNPVSVSTTSNALDAVLGN